MLMNRLLLIILVILVISATTSCGPGAEPVPQDEVPHTLAPGDIPALAPSAPLYVDYDRNVYIPAEEDLVRNLQVAFLYNSDSIQVRFRYETDRPSWYHQYLVYKDGEWVRHGGGSAGPDPEGLYEDRISLLLDDGSVSGFSEVGGFITMHPGMRTLTSEVPAEEVEYHPHLGSNLDRSDVRKFIPESRFDDMDGDQWQRTRGQSEIRQLQEDGMFLDLWQWRAHRSNPLGYADNGYVLDYRHSSDGTGMYTDNQNDDGRPLYMFDPEITGRHALRLDQLIDRQYGQDDPYYIYEGNSVPFDPDYNWENGDAIPQRFLREPDGSRGALKADGFWQDGVWDVSLTRTLEAPDPFDSKTIEEGEVYYIAFAVHADASGARWHYVSVPFSLGIGEGTEADMRASYTDGPLSETDTRVPSLSENRSESTNGLALSNESGEEVSEQNETDVTEISQAEWYDIPVFYPGQVDYSWLLSPDHPGNIFVREHSMHMLEIHHLEVLSRFIVRQELEMLGEDPVQFGIDPDLGYEY